MCAKKSEKRMNEESKLISINFTKNKIILKENGPYTTVIMEKGFPKCKPGQPALPWQKFFISVPWDAVPGELIIKDIETTTLAEGIIIEPCQPNVPTLLGTKVEQVPPDSEIYGSETLWPEVFARVINVKRMGGYGMAELEICPFRYHLGPKKLELIERMDMTLSYKQTGVELMKTRSIITLKHEQKFMERVKKMVLNPEDVSVYQHIKGMEFLTDLSTYPQINYVIITSNSLADKFSRLAHWRNLMGLRSKVVTVEDIVNGTVPDTGGATFWHTSGYYDGGTRDVAESIRNFIKWASVNWLTDFVLLGGDTEIIPARQAIQSGVGNLDYRDIDSSDTSIQLGYSPLASTEKSGKSAGNVVDNDVNTVWECTPTDPDPSIRLEVGHNKPVNRVAIVWGTNYAPSYVIQVTHDGITWTDVHTTSSGMGGTEEINFPCISARYVRLRITGGTNFSIASMRIYGPSKGVAYRINDKVTRIYLSSWMTPNPANSLDENLILIREGPNAGKIILYDENSSDTTPGWHFVEDLTEPNGIISSSTSFIEIRGPVPYHGNPFLIKNDTNYIAADLYYSDIAAAEYSDSANHDWDADRNGVYGERYANELDSVNGISDISIGRAPAQSPEKVDTFIDKIIHYEMFQDKDEFGFPFLLPSDFAVSVLLGAENWFSNSPGSLDATAAGKEDIRDMFKAYDPSRWIFTRRYQDNVDVPAADQTADLGPADKTEILNAIKKGQNIVSLSSHGSPGYLCYLVTNDIDDVVNHPSIFYGNACSTNKFDEPIGEAFGEWTILNPKGAGVAYLGNSRFGWTGDNYIEKAFWEEMLKSDRLGEMFDACKIICHDWAKYSLNLLGDPAMRVWSDRPKQLNVSHAAEICTGNQTFKVIVKSGVSPVQDALVCVTMGEALFGVGTTNSSGVASLAIVPAAAGTMRVTVSGRNLIPYLGSVNTKKCDDGGCRSRVVCIPKLICPSIICKTAISCKNILACPKALVCPKILSCIKLGACGVRVGVCPRIQPEDFRVFEHVFEIFGIGDMNEFAKKADTPEIKETIDRLPNEIRKSIRMMFERIKLERNLD